MLGKKFSFQNRTKLVCVQTSPYPKKTGRGHQSVSQTMSSENWTKLCVLLQTLLIFEDKYE